MEKSISKNSILYLIDNIINVILPFFSSMYIVRVLLPINVGEVAYAQNIVQYFVVFSFLGIPTYALREISKNRNNKDELNNVYSELMIINLVSTLFFLMVYVICVFCFFKSEITLFIITGLSIVLNVFNNSWLFEALEEFKYITIRNLIYKLIAYGGIFLFVKTPDDYLIYAAMSAIGTTGNYLFNIIYSRKYVKLQFRGLNLTRHLKSIFMLVCVNLAIEIYTMLDTTMLGIFCDKDHVAFYTYGNRIIKIFVQLISTFTVVMVPRLSFYYNENRLEEFNDLITKTFKVILILSIPAIIGIQFVGDYCVCALFGETYISSALVLKILSVVMLIKPTGYLLGSRVLLVSGNENKMIRCVSVGAVMNLIGNYFLIPLYQEFGAAWASVVSEFFVMLIYVFCGKKFFELKNMFITYRNILIAVFWEIIFLACIGRMIKIEIGCTVVQIVGSIVIYFIVLNMLKEPLIIDYKKQIIKKISHY